MASYTPERNYIPASSNETSPLSNEDLIAQKILKRVEIAKMTRQLKEKLYKAGQKVRDQNQSHSQSQNPSLQHSGYPDLQSNHLNSSNSSSQTSSPSKSLSEDVTNNITATAISNIQNSKLLTPTKSANSTFQFENTTLPHLTPSISPLKRKSVSSIYRSTTSSRNLLYENFNDDDNDNLISPVKRMNNGTGVGLNSSPFSTTSPYQYTRGSLIQTPQSLPNSQNSQHQQSVSQPPRTPPQKQVDIFQNYHRQAIKDIKPFTELDQNQTVPKKKNKKGANSNYNTDSNDNNNIEFVNTNVLLSTPKSASFHKTKEFTTPNKISEDLGADLLIFLSNSPVRNYTGGNHNNNGNSSTSSSKEQRELNKILTIPTTPKSSNANHINITALESTPLRNQFFSPSIINTNTPSSSSNNFLQPLLGTPIGISSGGNTSNSISNTNRFQNPATPNRQLGNNHAVNINRNINRTPGFSMSDYINFTPSPRVTRTPDYARHMNNYPREFRDDDRI